MSRKMYRHSRRPASRVVKGESRTVHMLHQSRIRLSAIVVCFGFSFTVLALRLLEVGLVGGGELPFKRLVAEPHLMLQAEEKAAVSAPTRKVIRRSIKDRNGVVLATSVRSAALAVNPSLIRKPRLVAKELSQVLSGVSERTLLDKLTKPNSKFAYLKRHLTPSEQAEVNALGVPGLFFENNAKRTYPFGDLAAHVVGYVDIDNNGLAGIEKQFDKRLARGLTANEDVTLSLDMRVQSIVAEEMAAAVKKFDAIGATGVVADVKSGEILSMVSMPSYDPHKPGIAKSDQKFNRASLGVYEMGSTFKTFTVAMALDKGIVGLRDGYDASKPIKIGGHRINDSHPYYRWLSVPEIFAYSSNIGTVKMAMDVGIKPQQSFLKKLGMMEAVDIELPERGHPMVPRDWKKVNAMTISYGHGISVSPLHVVRGISAMVNGGTVNDLTLMKRHGELRQGKRIISEKTSRRIRKLMGNVVDYGTASKAKVRGYAVGGKTGTAEKIVGGRYKEDAKLTSFIGAFPMDDPHYVVFIVIDEPKPIKETFGYATGGWMAAPVVANIVERMGMLYGIEPVFQEPDVGEEKFWKEATLKNKWARERRYKKRAVHAASY